MDRMRAGLTGLGIVFLSTLAASLVFGPSSDSPAAKEHVKAPEEPLAQLGVAPGMEKGVEKGLDGDPIQPDDPLAATDPALSVPLPADPAVPPDAGGESPASRPMGSEPHSQGSFASGRPVAI
jgi:hypothetical protein